LPPHGSEEHTKKTNEFEKLQFSAVQLNSVPPLHESKKMRPHKAPSPSSGHYLSVHTALTALLGTFVHCLKRLAALLSLHESVHWLLSMGVRKVPAGLPVVEDVEQVSERCHRVLGLNPGPHTLHGTNTYLVGAGHALVLVDAGEASTSAAWVAALLQVLQQGDRRITDVLLSHGHFDHSGGVSALLAEMQRRGMPLPNVHKRRITASGDGVGEECGCYPARGFPCLHLRDGQEFTCPGEGGGE